MEEQRWIAGLVLGALFWVPAVRLLGRSREERLVGLFFLASGVGFGARVASVDGTVVDVPLNAIGHIGLSLACIALYRFTRVVFRPAGSGGRIAEGLGIAATVATLAGVFLFGGVASEQSPSVIAANVARLCSYAWSFGEALHYWTLTRRRLALGLAERFVVNRFGLWSVWMGGLTTMLGTVLFLRVAGQLVDADAALQAQAMPWLRAVLASIGLASVAAIWLTFFPPRAYVRRLESPAP